MIIVLCVRDLEHKLSRELSSLYVIPVSLPHPTQYITLATRMSHRTLSFGNMDSFNPDNEAISVYLERFDLFIQANGIADEKKVPVFLSVLGGKTYSLLRNLLSLALPKD